MTHGSSFSLSSAYPQIILEPFISELPDFLLKFVDEIIKIDNYNSLRYDFLHYSLEQLIYGETESREIVWLFVDPLGDAHLLLEGGEQSFKGSKNNLPIPQEFIPATEAEISSLRFRCQNVLEQRLQVGQLQQLRHLKLISIDQIRLNCEANLYTSCEDFQGDVRKIIGWNQVYRATSFKTFQYLSVLYEKIVGLFVKKDFFRKFHEIKMSDLTKLTLYDMQYRTNCENWPIIPVNFRQYEQVSEYIPTPANREKEIFDRIISKKQSIQCPEDCVCTRDCLEEGAFFCRYSLLNGWETQCPNRARKIECDHMDEDRMRRCRNAEIRKGEKKRRVNGDQDGEIEERLTWGIDLYTRNIIYHCLPQLDLDGLEKSSSESNRDHFIEKTLTKAMNFLGQSGYSLIDTCSYILQHSKRQSQNDDENLRDYWYQRKATIQEGNWLFSARDYQYAKLLMRNYELSPDKTVFRIHTKGKGAICVEKGGIKQGSFIVEYYGQLYQPWRWYDREDFIKQIMKKKKLKNFIPQFYNIYLEKHQDQPLGYDILVVDPSRKGNFSSRFSHSCDPNCGTIITVSNGKYYIGMYSFRDIEYGQQLTFDYCSMTQSNYEHLNSICLCGMRRCRGNYLQLSNSKIFNNLMDNKNCFYERNSVVLKATGPVTPWDLETCARHNIKEGFLMNTPSWIIRWMARLLVFIEQQGQIYKQGLISQWQSAYPWDSKADEEQKSKNIQLFSQTNKQDLISIRFQNLITSIDKLKFFFSKNQNTQVPPIYLQNDEKIIQILITKEDSVLQQLTQSFLKYKCERQVRIIQIFQRAIDSKESNKQKLFFFRLCCLAISHCLLFREGSGFSNELMSDIVYFYSFTHTYFSCFEYKSFESDEIVVMVSEITGQRNAADKKQRTKKKYSSPFVWGQLVSWFKQTIVCPEASLSQDRRGTLSYPLIRSILRSSYPYEKSRAYFLKYIRQKPANSWPPSSRCELSFKNPYKLYGSMMFQNIHSKQKLAEKLPKQNLLESCLSIANEPLSQKLALFKKVELLLEGISQDSQLYEIMEDLGIDLRENIPLQVRRQSALQGEPKKKIKREELISE